HLEKDALKRAHEARFPFEVAKLMSAQGLMGITIPAADGGVGGTLMDAVIAIEQVAAVCPRSADVVQFGNFGPIRTFAEYATPAQKARWLPELHHRRAVELHERRAMVRAAFRELPRAGGKHPARTRRLQEADFELQHRAHRQCLARARLRALRLQQGARLRLDARAVRPPAV